MLDTKRDVKCVYERRAHAHYRGPASRTGAQTHTVCLCKQQEFKQTHTHRRVFEWSCGGVTGKGRRGSVGVTGQAGLGAERPGECQALCRRRWPLKRRSLDVMHEPLKQPSRFRHLMYA